MTKKDIQNKFIKNKNMKNPSDFMVFENNYKVGTEFAIYISIGNLVVTDCR